MIFRVAENEFFGHRKPTYHKRHYMNEL